MSESNSPAVKTILFGVCGGVAAYKTLDVVSALRKQGHDVHVSMTEAATHFVGPTCFSAVSGTPTITTMWPDVQGGDFKQRFPHLYPATEADLFVCAPATADMIAQLAHGFGKDVVSTSALGLTQQCIRVFCPSMNKDMWANPIVQANIQILRDTGWIQVGPEDGHLACGVTGSGRMREPASIVVDLQALLHDSRQDLAEKRILILSGPTHEHLDPIRYIGNPSSGLMGKALAEKAVQRGASVAFITGPVHTCNLPSERGLDLVSVTSAEEMLTAAREEIARADAIVYTAAVADYRPETKVDTKMPKSGKGMTLTLVPTPDLSATLNTEKNEDVPAIGFALQTEDGETSARGKLERKGLDGIVLNYPNSLGASTGTFSFLGRGNDGFTQWGDIDKTDAASLILDQIVARLP